MANIALLLFEILTLRVFQAFWAVVFVASAFLVASKLFSVKK